MSFAPDLSPAGPTVAGGALPSGAFTESPRAERLLGMVQRMMHTGMAMARGINRIARHRLAGVELARLAPAGFNVTRTNARIVEAVAWTAALRERIYALTAKPNYAKGPSKGDRAGRARGTGTDPLSDGQADAAEGDRLDWKDLARPLRIGPGGVAWAASMMAKMSNREVVGRICDNLGLAASELGGSADIGRIAALEAAARALCPDPEAACPEAASPGPDVAKDVVKDDARTVVADAGRVKGASGVWHAGSDVIEPERKTGYDGPPPSPD